MQKNGGVLTSEISTADYAVLYSRSTTFKELLNNAHITHTPAVSFHFVLDAVNQGSIPENLENYLFNTKQNLKKRKPTYSSAAEAETRRLAKNAKRAERKAKEKAEMYKYVARSGTPEDPPPPPPVPIPPTPTTVKKGTSATPKPKSSDQTLLKGKEKGTEKGKVPVSSTSSVKKPPMAAASTSTSASASSSTATKTKKKASYYPRDRSPTPPTRVEKTMQGYSYTQEEKDWTEKYLFVLFKRDPDMSQTAVSRALHNKVWIFGMC